MQIIPEEFLNEVSGSGVGKTVLKTTAKLALGAIALTTAAGAKFGYDVHCECEKMATAFGESDERVYHSIIYDNFAYRTPYERLVYRTANHVFDKAYYFYIN